MKIAKIRGMCGLTRVPCIVILIFLNIIVFWIMFAFISHDDERAQSAIQKGMESIQTLKDNDAKGKRNTYCDHLRHLVRYHNVDTGILLECSGMSITDLQKTLIEEGIYE